MTSCPRVAYFCMEYGLDPSFSIYAGGLGILAGDHMKSVGDLHAPVTGIGLLWDEGYTRQVVGAGGAIEDQYPKTDREAVRPIDARVDVTIRGKKVPLRAWKVERFIRSNLYLLEPEREEDRWITQRLYGGGAEDRIAQEIVLGVGGVRLLDALGLPIDVFHFNEGHAVFAGLELLRQHRYGGSNMQERLANLRSHVVFTTHTPVPAGNEVHDLALLRTLDADLGFTDDELAVIGEDDPRRSDRTPLLRSPGTAGSTSTPRSSSLPSRVRAKRNSSSSTVLSARSVRAISRRAAAQPSMCSASISSAHLGRNASPRSPTWPSGRPPRHCPRR